MREGHSPVLNKDEKKKSDISHLVCSLDVLNQFNFPSGRVGQQRRTVLGPIRQDGAAMHLEIAAMDTHHELRCLQGFGWLPIRLP